MQPLFRKSPQRRQKVKHELVRGFAKICTVLYIHSTCTAGAMTDNWLLADAVAHLGGEGGALCDGGAYPPSGRRKLAHRLGTQRSAAANARPLRLPRARRGPCAPSAGHFLTITYWTTVHGHHDPQNNQSVTSFPRCCDVASTAS